MAPLVRSSGEKDASGRRRLQRDGAIGSVVGLVAVAMMACQATQDPQQAGRRGDAAAEVRIEEGQTVVEVAPDPSTSASPNEPPASRATRESEPIASPADEPRQDASVAPIASRAEPSAMGDPFAGTEEMIVMGSAGDALLASPVATSAIGFDSMPAAASPSRMRSDLSRPSWSGPPPEPSLDRYDAFAESGFVAVRDRPLSTFSIDVDTAAYTNLRRFLQEGMRPPRGAIRIEEMLNYFRYSDGRAEREATESDPLAVDAELFEAPWDRTHHLVRVSIAGRTPAASVLPARNLVFLVDVSGSMQGPDRLPWVKRGLGELVETLRPEDRVAIVVYAGASGLALEPTPGDRRDRILAALDRLEAGGSTAGSEGIQLAYRVARRNFDPEGINRVVLATDGDFNVGITDRSQLLDLIEAERESGVFLSVLGFGRGNLNDAGMEELADHGNGNYAYVDSPAEARRVLVHEAGSTLVTIARDVKIQAEFNPARVQAYRLVGYENRRLADRDFNDDRKDAGEVGAGHRLTALYEIVPVGAAWSAGVDPLKYQRDDEEGDARDRHADRDGIRARHSDEWMTIKLRHQPPGGGRSRLVERVVRGPASPVAEASESARFAAAVALFGMLLQDSEFKGEGDYDLVRRLARGSLGTDERGERAEFVRLVALAEELRI